MKRQDKLYLSSRINVKINIDPGGYFYGKTKKTFTGTQSVHQQPHRALSYRGCRRCAGHHLKDLLGDTLQGMLEAEIKNRGVEDIMIVSVDGLTGFGDAISAVFPKAEIQRCIVHQIRYSTKFISYKDIKPFMKELKQVYQAPTEEAALEALDSLEGKMHE